MGVCMHPRLAQGVLVFALTVAAGAALAASPGASDSTAPNTEVSRLLTVSTYAGRTSVSDMQGRIKELDSEKDHVPKNQTLLLRELDHLSAEIDTIEKADDSLPDADADLTAEQQYAQQVETTLGKIAAVDCTANSGAFTSEAPSVQQPLQQAQQLSFKYGNIAAIGPAVNELFQSFNPFGNASTPTSRCDAVKSIWSDTAKHDQIVQTFNSTESVIAQKSKSNANYRQTSQDLLTKLKERAAMVQTKIDDSSAQQQIGGDLKWILIIIGVFSVTIFWGVGYYTPEIQMEWVASGQVIQFVTVMILLIVVMALGLSNILQENTLGTLLGGLAGYVLAQGVGRSAARTATRNAQPDASGQGTDSQSQPPQSRDSGAKAQDRAGTGKVDASAQTPAIKTDSAEATPVAKEVVMSEVAPQVNHDVETRLRSDVPKATSDVALNTPVAVKPEAGTEAKGLGLKSTGSENTGSD